MKYIFLTILTTLLLTAGCDQPTSHHKKARHREIECYRRTSDSGGYFYYYVLYDSHSDSYYSYESNTQLTTFRSVNWVETSYDPTETSSFQSAGYDEPTEVDVTSEDLPQTVEVDLEQGEPAVEGESEGSSSSSESSESGSGDSGSSGGDGGGGDGGGGDGGGGD